jgi:hypothetical protein
MPESLESLFLEQLKQIRSKEIADLNARIDKLEQQTSSSPFNFLEIYIRLERIEKKLDVDD